MLILACIVVYNIIHFIHYFECINNLDVKESERSNYKQIEEDKQTNRCTEYERKL